jgi:transposase InsO family protein
MSQDPRAPTRPRRARLCLSIDPILLSHRRSQTRRVPRGDAHEPPDEARRRDACSPAVVPRETRSYEVGHVNALWHYDFHVGRRQVLTASGEHKTPHLFGILDDCSRVCCHAQWYEDEENSEDLVHGFCQGIQKRKVPRATIRDRGGAMSAAEVVQGLERLSIVDYPTLPYSPQQNAKQEPRHGRCIQKIRVILAGKRVPAGPSVTAILYAPDATLREGLVSADRHPGQAGRP